MRSLRWIVGRDLLMFSSASDAEVVRLPSRPKRLDDEQLWFPVSHRNAAIVGPVYPVGLRVSGPLLRVLCAEDVRFVCGADVRVSGEPARILGSLDAADPSRLRWLERKMHGLRADRLDSLDLLSDNSRKTSRNDLSPAATTMCSTIERDPVGAHHAAEFERKGARGILTVLEDRGLEYLNHGPLGMV